MELKQISGDYTVCKLPGLPDFTAVQQNSSVWFLAKTDEEISLVCETSCVPERTTEREDGFHVFRIEGVLDFSLIGILSKLSTILADNGIGIFAVSTFNTDYILVKTENYENALKLLSAAGYTIK